MKIEFLKMIVTSVVLSVSCLVNIANAGLITFEGENGLADGAGNFIEVGDFRFTVDDGSHIVITSQNNIVDINSTKLFVTNYSQISMSRIDGGLFNLDSFDIGGSWADANLFSRWASSVDLFASDGSTANAIIGPAPSYNNYLAGFMNISSVQWTPQVNANQGGNNYEFTLDNISWSTSTSVPEPSTLAIFALGMMGLASRRLKKQ